MTIDQFNFAGKKAFVRVDFNVPLDDISHGVTGLWLPLCIRMEAS